jgi:hypothetical protein
LEGWKAEWTVLFKNPSSLPIFFLFTVHQQTERSSVNSKLNTGRCALDTHLPFYILAVVFMLVGLIAAVLPILPGPVLIWLGALTWAWAGKFEQVGWTTLIILAVIGVVAMTSDIVASLASGKKAGLSWHFTAAAIAGGLFGGILLSVLPILGTIGGAILGSLCGVMLMQYHRTHDWAQARQAAKVYAVGFLLGRVTELVLDLIMVGVFIFAAVRK